MKRLLIAAAVLFGASCFASDASAQYPNYYGGYSTYQPSYGYPIYGYSAYRYPRYRAYGYGYRPAPRYGYGYGGGPIFDARSFGFGPY